MRIMGKTIHYFRGLPPRLGDFSRPIYFPTLPSVGLVEERARALARFLDSIRADRIDLIAHSMGGLDCRYVMYHLDPQQRIRSLTSIATPHRGTPLAQWVLEGKGPLYPLLHRISQPGVRDLTPSACARFNAEIGDRPDARYRSFAGVRSEAEVPLIFRPWTRAMQYSDGDNDSQVPLASAKWGEFQGTLRADHFELAGWSFAWPNRPKERPFDHFGFYRRLVQELCSG